ncbi:MAG: hypothetical protein AAFQ81_04015 [Pseudomonadota bacterium]
MTDSRKPRFDWEAIEREYRAGQLSIMEIARRFGLTDAAIRKRAKRDGWTRDLGDDVRRRIKDKRVREPDPNAGRELGSGSGSERATDEDLVERAASRGFEVEQSHRRDLTQLHGLKRLLATRLSQVLHNEPVDGPCLGDKESPGDLLEKLARVSSRLIPLERQAYSLDDPNAEGGLVINVEGDDARL